LFSDDIVHEFGEMTQITLSRRSRSFKVTDFGTNRLPISD